MRPGVRKLRARIVGSPGRATPGQGLPATLAPEPVKREEEQEPGLPAPQESVGVPSEPEPEAKSGVDATPEANSSQRWLVDAKARPSARAEIAARPARGRGVPWEVGAIVLAALALAGGIVAFLVLYDDGDGEAPSSAPVAKPARAALDERRARTALREIRGIAQVGGILGEDRDLPTLQVFADVTSSKFALFDDAVLPKLLERYVRPGLLKVQLRTIPGDEALDIEATQWTQAAGLQTRLWDYARVLAAFEGAVATEGDLRAAARFLGGLEANRLEAAGKSARVERAIARAQRFADDAGITSTPAFTVTDGARTERLLVPRLSARFTTALADALRRLKGPSTEEGG